MADWIENHPAARGIGLMTSHVKLISYSVAFRYTINQDDQELRHKHLKQFFETGSKAGIQPKHATKLTAQLTFLQLAWSPEKMDVAGWDWHPLKGELAGLWAVSVNGDWRLTFGFEGEDAVLVDCQDYH